MVAPRVDRGRFGLGSRPLSADERALLADACPGASGAASVRMATIELLTELRRRDAPDLLLLLCQLSRADIDAELGRLVSEQALPASIDPLTAEVLAETLDAVRATPYRTIEREFQEIERRCRRVVRAFVDDCVGFVPLLSTTDDPEPIAQSLAERVALPESLFELVAGALAPTATRVIAAQALLQLARHDRSALLHDPAPHPAPAAGPPSSSVAHLLSRSAALERFRTEFDHSIAWAKACIRHPSITLGRNHA